ncbi:unnamed protein product [Prorocentrum cordatum]|uniref:Reverse transcriptase Ty1/copia-type domain-containing protein n=1 Tax=Prorocentrum cordatum TaxID=2364126 RepID=A0ABN9PW00_9DINO|nr:unnamed protein product [Polarella glacialis]
MQAKANDVAHKKKDRRDELIPLLSFDYGQAGIEGGPVNFEFAVGSDDASTGGIWSTAIIQKGRGDVYTVASAVSRLAELGPSRVELKSGGAAGFSFIMAARARAIKDGICETILMGQSERYNSQANGRAEKGHPDGEEASEDADAAGQQEAEPRPQARHPIPYVVAKACSVALQQMHGGINLVPYGKTHMLKHQKPIVAAGEAVICRRPGAQVNKLEVDEHLIGTPTGARRSTAAKRKMESRRWDKELFDKMRSPGREREGGEGNEGKKSRVTTIQMISAVREMREKPQVEDDETRPLEDDFTEVRKERLEKIAGDGKKIAQAIPIKDTTSKIPTGKWVDIYQADGSKKSRWTTRGFEQQVHGHENFVATTPSLPHLKAMLANAELHDHVVALGDCSGAFYQAHLAEDRIFLEPPPEVGVLEGHVREAMRAFPGPKGAPKAWEDHSANTMEELEMARGHYDGCLFMKLSNRMKAGRRADDFLIAGPSGDVDKLLDAMGERLKSLDAVELTKNGDQATFLNMQVGKVEGGYTISGKTSLIDDILKELGLDTAKPSVLFETKNEMRMKNDELKVDTVGHSRYRRYCSGVLVDADWADDKTDRISTSGGILKYRGCTDLSWSRRQGCVAFSSAESELYALGSAIVFVFCFLPII